MHSKAGRTKEKSLNPQAGDGGTQRLAAVCAGESESPFQRGRCYVFMSYLRHSLWKLLFFFFFSEPHKIAFCSIEINLVYVRETFPATVGFALNPISCSLILLWVSLVYFLSCKW